MFGRSAGSGTLQPAIMRRMTTSLPSPFGTEPTYWRRSRSIGDEWYRLEGGLDWRLVRGQWEPANRYKHGPTWWRLTGETSVDQIHFDELPSGTPR